MDLKSYRNLFIVVTLILTLIAASPVIAIVVPFQDGSEGFSEFWLLGPDHIAKNYPFNVSSGEVHKIFVGLVNQMGSSEYYMVHVKFRNSTQFLLELNSSKPSSLAALYEFRFFVENENVWELPVNFGFQDVSIRGDVVTVGNVIVNGKVFPASASTGWDSKTNGFYFQLFFELWRYDVISQAFKFDDRVIGIWINMTGFLD